MEVSVSSPPPPKATPHELLSEARTAMEAIAAKMLSLKKDPSSSSSRSSSSAELITNMSLLFASLRQTNRSILVEEDRAKAEMEKARAPVDSTMLQLHNLMYEKNHYLKAIKACRDFRSKYPDITLVPESDFFADAPDNIKGGASLSDDAAHDLTLKRLNYELFQRKELCKLQEKLVQRKRCLSETISTRKKFLSSLPSHLKSLKKASLPVQQQLGMLHTKKSKQHRAAELLPPPLYVTYTQLLSQKEAFGEKIELEIVGSMKDAQAYAVQQSNKDNGIDANTENTRLEDETPDDEDDCQRRRKRPRKLPSKDGLEDARMYQSHPLNVILHVYDDEDESDSRPLKLLTLKFEHLVKLNVICVGNEQAEGPEDSILCNLFPDDPGLELPHQIAKLYAGKSLEFDKKISRPYKWAQHLAGVDFLPEVAPLLISHESSDSETCKGSTVLSGLSLYRHQNRVETLLQRIRSRRKAQLALLEQLDSLAKLKWPSPIYENIPWAAKTPVCAIERWSNVKQELEASLAVTSLTGEQDLEISHNAGDGSETLKDGVESVTEDGELPSVAQAPAIPDGSKFLTPSKNPIVLEHSRSFSLIAKSSASSKGISPRSAKQDDLELVWDSESDNEKQDLAPEEDGDTLFKESSDNSWEKYGICEYELVLSRADKDKALKLRARVIISIEYPVRPPSFSLSFCDFTETGTKPDIKWYNELRAMEAEVNLHILKIIPLKHEKYVLAHQVLCLAMLFDFHFDQLQNCSETMKCNSIIDLGLCKPITGKMVARSLRGRDRRKMFSWKSIGCASGYPY